MPYSHKCGPKEGRWVRMQSAERLFLVSGSFLGQQHSLNVGKHSTLSDDHS
uniref:Uncharacterized protein n=1 Tax=Heterorhabditis bacteriophora TaxID=37862 RepID=A0A1I7WW95_HETBA